MNPEEPGFDPYHRWLGIQPKDQPPTAYRLLGIELFESDPDVIQDAADQRMAHVRTYQTGKRSALSQRILSELSAAKLCLLNPQQKALYDAALRHSMAAVNPGPFPALESFDFSAPARTSHRPERPKLPLWIPLAAVGAGAATLLVVLLLAGRSQPQPLAEAAADRSGAGVPSTDEAAPASDQAKAASPDDTAAEAGRAAAPVKVASSDPATWPRQESAVRPELEAANAPAGMPAPAPAKPVDPPPAAPKPPPAGDPGQPGNPPESPAGKQPRPDAAAEKQGREWVRERFGAEYAAAKSSPERLVTLAGALLQHAGDAPDPATRFACLDVARSVGVDAGNLMLALEAIDEIDKAFQVDGLDDKRVKASEDIAGKMRSPADNAALLKQLLALIDDWFAGDKLEPAANLAKTVVAVARKTHDPAALKSAAARGKLVEEAAKTYAAEVQPARATLETSPGDPSANLAVGKWLCFLKEEWPQGLKLLALGDDPALKELAEKEIAGSNTLKVADGWWNLSLKESKVKQQLQAHAAGLYREALPVLVGPDKKRAEQRLADAGGGEAKPAKTASPARPPKRSRVSERAVKIFAVGCDGHDICLNGAPLLQRVGRDTPSGTAALLHVGDIIAVRLQGRFDIMSLSMVFLTEDDQFLFETSPAWTGYLPPNQDLWWDVQNQKIAHQPAITVGESREYVDLVKKTMASVITKYPVGDPICSPLQNTQAVDKEKRAGYLPTYVYYVVTKEDLAPKKK